jgi:hypothetical protein
VNKSGKNKSDRKNVRSHDFMSIFARSVIANGDVQRHHDALSFNNARAEQKVLNKINQHSPLTVSLMVICSTFFELLTRVVL